MDNSETGNRRGVRGFFRKRVLSPLTRQLTQGTDPRSLARALAIGGTIAINPFLGTTTAGCLLAGVLLRLNQPALQVSNVLAVPAQLLLIVPWVRAGEWLYSADPISIQPTTLAGQFSADPWAFLEHFGKTGVYAATAWLIAAPFIACIIYCATRPPISALARRIGTHRETETQSIGHQP